MIRNTSLIWAGVLAATGAACTPSPPPAPPRVLSAAKVLSAATCAVGSPNFLDHVQFAPNGLPPPSADAETLPALRLRPDTTPPVPVPSKYTQALQNAFQLAPTAFQDRLCGLTGIYINGPVPNKLPAGTSSKLADSTDAAWGFRVWHLFAPYETYIAIPAALWDLACADGTKPYIYHCFETDLLRTVVTWPNSPPPGSPPPPQYSSANAGADNFDMTILAALAHEVGHVQWYQTMAPHRPGNSIFGYDPSGFLCADSPGPRSFFSYSWASAIATPPPWRSFSTKDVRKVATGDLHLLPPPIADIDSDIDHDNPTSLKSATDNIGQLYQRAQPWATYFAAVSADEDFVETYKLYILTNAQTITDPNNNQPEGRLTSLPIVLNGHYHDIPYDYLAQPTKKPVLFTKVKCIAPVI